MGCRGDRDTGTQVGTPRDRLCGRSSPRGPVSVCPRGCYLTVRLFPFFSEEMPYLKCPLHTVLKLTPVAYGECGDTAPATPCSLGMVAAGGSRAGSGLSA